PQSEIPALKTNLLERALAKAQVVPTGWERTWVIDLGVRHKLLRDQPLFLRAKFFAAQTNLSGAYQGRWGVGPPGPQQYVSAPMSLAADTFLELRIDPSPNRLDENGKLFISFINQNEAALLFPLDEGIEVLYRE